MGEMGVGCRTGLQRERDRNNQQQQQRAKPNRHQRLRQTLFNEQEQDEARIENLPWGDPILMKPQEGSVPIYFINKNGLSSNNKFEEILEIRQELMNVGVSIVGLAETNKDWSRPGLQSQSTQAWRQFFGPSTWTTASSSEITGDDY